MRLANPTDWNVCLIFTIGGKYQQIQYICVKGPPNTSQKLACVYSISCILYKHTFSMKERLMSNTMMVQSNMTNLDSLKS